jgi:hypothetical protein
MKINKSFDSTLVIFIIFKTLICFISEEGASKEPCSAQYCGPSPFSESEVKSVPVLKLTNFRIC